MEFFEAVEKRYSHKQPFADTPVLWQDLEKIANAGLLAPNANNAQCVQLVILENKEALAPMLDVAARDRLESAPAAIAVFTDGKKHTGGKNFEMEDYSAAAAQMLLAATALGYVSVWLDSPYFSKEAQEKACKALGVPESHTLRVLLPIGHPAQGPIQKREKQPFWARVSRNKYGIRE